MSGENERQKNNREKNRRWKIHDGSPIKTELVDKSFY
jgi:hypothetical protein